MSESSKGGEGPVVSGETWTTRRLLAWMTERFEAKRIDASRVVAEMLLAHVLRCDRMRLYMEVDREAGADELRSLRDLVRRASEHEPVQYLVGRASFFGREFAVDPSTMIPQPSTEDLVSAVLACCGADEREHVEVDTETAAPGMRRADPEPAVADIGTGSGCIAISLAIQMPRARLVATDIVPAALELARGNASRLGVDDRIDFRDGSLLEPLGAERFDVVCGNLPYIPDTEWASDDVQRAVREHVPASALRGGREGLDFIRPVIAGAGAHLDSGGHLVLEIADCQRDAVIALAEAADDLTDARVEKDYEGLWRVLVARRV